MDRIQEAMNVCYYAHGSQLDKSEGIYMFHPLRVRDNLIAHPAFAKLSKPAQQDAEVAAILHDVIEDSPKFGYRKYKSQDLLDLGFTKRSIELVVLLTRTKEVNDEDYYAAIRSNKLARLVKWADLADNLNEERAGKLDEKLRNRLAKKYAHALEELPMDKATVAWLEDRKKVEIPYRHWEKSRWIYEWAES